jgi:hypothetical protein
MERNPVWSENAGFIGQFAEILQHINRAGDLYLYAPKIEKLISFQGLQKY